MRKLLLLPLLFAAGAFTARGLSKPTPPPLKTVASVDIPRYMGTWYEIAALPQVFEQGCFASRAEYSLNDDGTVHVKNSCRRGSLDGPESAVQGTARVVDSATNAKLAVTFFGFVTGDYWILDLAGDYSYAVVGEPQRQAFWVLSRTPQLDAATLAALLERGREVHGYDLTKLRMTVQQ